MLNRFRDEVSVFAGHSGSRSITENGKRAGVYVLALLLVVAAVVAAMVGPWRAGEAQSTDGRTDREWTPEISAIGAVARGDVPRPAVDELLARGFQPDGRSPMASGLQGNDRLVHSATASGFQSGTSVAVNGSEVVVGYTDERGYALPFVSLSGYAYSTDGGGSWTDGGQLPTSGSGDEIFGLSDIKTWTDPGTSQRYFFYSSLYKTAAGENSLCLHVSLDGGATWSMPREVTPATSAADFPDKPFIDVDEETGRIFISWTNFGATTSIRVSYSDDQGMTWSTPTVFASLGQGSIPRADGGTQNVYVSWRSLGTLQLARSTDNGQTWSSPATIASNVVDPMNPYGVDRIHGFPSMDVDDETGTVYVAYASRYGTADFGDIFFTRSFDQGQTFSTPVPVNLRNPANDRAQFFPWITVDQTTLSVNVVWYDQANGDGATDVTDVFHTHSKDLGTTWTCPSALTDAPFHAEFGNTPSEPNLGDYIQAASIGGKLYTAFAKTDSPSYLTYAPDTYIDISDQSAPGAPIGFVRVGVLDAGCESGNGFPEPGETVDLVVTIKNLSNCVDGVVGLTKIPSITGRISTSNPGVTITKDTSRFPGLRLGGDIQTNSDDPFTIVINDGPIADPFLEIDLEITSAIGFSRSSFSLLIGKPNETVLLSETFNLVTPPALPAGWTTTTEAGANNPWESSALYFSSFPNAALGNDISTTSFSRLATPPLAIPANADLVDIEFRVTHDLETDFERKAWDGALLRVEIDDGVTTHVELAGAFSSLFTPFYGWQINRQDPAEQPLQGLSCWSSRVLPTLTQLKLQYAGLAGKTVRFFWDVGTDAQVGTTTGIFVDDVLVRSVEFTEGDCNDLVLDPPAVTFDAAPVGQTVCDTVRVINTASSAVIIDHFDVVCTNPDVFSVDTTAIDAQRTIAMGDSAFFVVCTFTAQPGEEAGHDMCEIQVFSTAPNSPNILPVTLDFVVVGIDDDQPRYPFEILAVAPNPFNPATTIRFALPERLPVTADVWSVTGARVRTLATRTEFASGINQLRWDGRNDNGTPVASGVYFVRISTRLGQHVARAVLLK